MPVNQFVQARIDLSRMQAKTVGEMFEKNMGAAIALEEANIPNVVAVIQQNKTTLVHHDGTKHDLGASAPQSRPSARPSAGRVR